MTRLDDRTFARLGVADLGPILDAGACKALLDSVWASRDFTRLFLTEDEYRANPVHKAVNPRPGRNLLGKLEADFIFTHPELVRHMSRVLGDRWRVLDHKLVMGVPESWMPAWLVEETRGFAAANLGAYVKPPYRDMTYFHGIDFHQDIIDFRTRDADFITVYCYLDDTAIDCSPLHVLPGSHELGASTFPHRIEKTPAGRYAYANDEGARGEYDCDILMGGRGTVYYWHSLTMHGTKPHMGDRPRVSVRLLMEKNTRRVGVCELDTVNQGVRGRLALEETRIDVDAAGNTLRRGNLINEIA